MCLLECYVFRLLLRCRLLSDAATSWVMLINKPLNELSYSRPRHMSYYRYVADYSLYSLLHTQRWSISFTSCVHGGTVVSIVSCRCMNCRTNTRVNNLTLFTIFFRGSLPRTNVCTVLWARRKTATTPSESLVVGLLQMCSIWLGGRNNEQSIENYVARQLALFTHSVVCGMLYALLPLSKYKAYLQLFVACLCNCYV